MMACRTGLALVSLFLSAGAQASHDDVPLGVLLDQSDIVAMGAVVRIDSHGDAGFEFAIVQVESYLRDRSTQHLPEIRIRQRSRYVSSTTLRLQVNMRAVFCLKQNDPIELDHPRRVVPASDRAYVSELLETRQNLAHGDPVGGLALRAELVGTQWLRSGQTEPVPQYHFFRISLLNTGAGVIDVDTQAVADTLRSDHEQVRPIGGRSALKHSLPGVLLPREGVIFFGPTARNTGAFMVDAAHVEPGARIRFLARLNDFEIISNQVRIPGMK